MTTKLRWNVLVAAALVGGLLWVGDSTAEARHGRNSGCGSWGGYYGGNGSHGGRGGLFGSRDRRSHHRDNCCYERVSCGSHGGYYGGGNGSHGGYYSQGGGSYGGHYSNGGHYQYDQGDYAGGQYYQHQGDSRYYESEGRYVTPSQERSVTRSEQQATRTETGRQEQRAYRVDPTYSDAPPAPPQIESEQSFDSTGAVQQQSTQQELNQQSYQQEMTQERSGQQAPQGQQNDSTAPPAVPSDSASSTPSAGSDMPAGEQQEPSPQFDNSQPPAPPTSSDEQNQDEQNDEEDDSQQEL